MNNLDTFFLLVAYILSVAVSGAFTWWFLFRHTVKVNTCITVAELIFGVIGSLIPIVNLVWVIFGGWDPFWNWCGNKVIWRYTEEGWRNES